MSNDDPLDIGQHEETPERDHLADVQEEVDLKWLVADPRGRRFLRGQLERSGIWRTSFTGDALSSAFREGERNAGLRLYDLIARHTPERLVDILTEGRK